MALAGQSFLAALIVIFLGFWPLIGMAADSEVLRPRVPSDQFEAVRGLENPYHPSTPELIEKGKGIFHGKGFCVRCHGKEGKGLGKIPGLRGMLPRDFTDKAW